MVKTLGVALAVFGASTLAHEALARSGWRPEEAGGRNMLILATAAFGVGSALARRRAEPWTSRDDAFYRLYVRSCGGRST